MCEALLMIHWREWKRIMPETPSGTEQISRATQPDVSRRGQSSDLLCNIWACSWMVQGWLVELLFELVGQVRLRSMQVTYFCQQELPCFCLALNIRHTPCPLSIMFFYTHSSWRSFDNLQSICPCFESDSGKTAGLSGCPAKPSIVQEFGDTRGSPFCNFPHFFTDIFEMQSPPYAVLHSSK